jgi:hypothetical protein
VQLDESIDLGRFSLYDRIAEEDPFRIPRAIRRLFAYLDRAPDG